MASFTASGEQRPSQGSQAQRDLKREANLDALLTAADASLAEALPKETVLDTDAESGAQAVLHEGPIDAALLAAAWETMPVELLTACQDKGRVHAHLNVAAIARLDKGAEFLQVIFKMIHALIVAGPYRVIHCEGVARIDDNDPYHQDKLTGRGAFKRDEALAKAAMRVLIDLGAYDGAHASRTMSFQIGGVTVYETQARMVAMNARAAGSGGFGPVYHGRFGNGFTMSIDLILPTRDRSGSAYTASRACFRFFGTTMSYLRHGHHAAGLDGRDGEHGRGTTLLTREHSVGATVAAMTAADAVVAEFAASAGASSSSSSSSSANAELDEDEVDLAAREAAFAYLEGIGTYDDNAICQQVDNLLDRTLDPLSREHCCVCLAHVSTGQRWRLLPVMTEAGEASRRHCTGCYAAHSRKEALVIACLQPACTRCTPPDGVTGKKRGRPSSKAKLANEAAATDSAAGSM
jgi:hypothetical protein